MSNTLRALVEALVNGGDTNPCTELLPAADAVELDSEEAWSDFQNSQMAYDQSFRDSQLGSL